jgi:DNA processing protein
VLINKLTLNAPDYPEILRNIPSPPRQLYHTGAPLEELLKRPCVAIVGTRKVSAYGREVTLKLARELAEQGIVIISGLALGVDALAHQATLDAGGLAIAVLPSPIEQIVPTTNRRLAQRILEQGGALVSEYDADALILPQNFIARNRIVSGLAKAVLITEASDQSGTKHTVTFANEQGKTIMAVPGDITRPGSVGVNSFIKSGASLITSYIDVLHTLNLADHSTVAREIRGRNDHEQSILDLLLQGVKDGDSLLEHSGLTAVEFNQTLTMLEISSKIRPLGANQWAIY